MTKTIEQLTSELQILKNQFSVLQNQIIDLTQNTNSRVRLSDLARSESILDAKIRDLAEIVVKQEKKLDNVVLPEDTKYYLEKSEIADFRSNFNKLLAMMASFEKLYKDLVAYSVNNVTNT